MRAKVVDNCFIGTKKYSIYAIIFFIQKKEGTLNMYAISLIIPTIGRKEEVENLLQSILELNYSNIAEIIIVDQNEENFLEEIVKRFEKKLNILHLRVNFKGAAKARNYGVKYATGDILGFPDDDSCILKNTLMRVNELLAKDSELIAIFGKATDPSNKTNIISYINYTSYIKFSNLYRTTIECSIFIRKQEFIKIGMFDEELGIGTYFGSEEGADLICRLLYKKYKMLYVPEDFYYHPNKKNEKNMKKYYSYGK